MTLSTDAIRKSLLETKKEETKGCIIPEHDGEPLFESGDGDFKLWVNGTCFETHKYLIKRFNGLKTQLREQPSAMALELQCDEDGIDDFRRTFKILYSSILEGPIEFDKQTLISALRIATAYDHPSLRSYAIKWLEKINLTAVERIKIARKFGLASWQEPAYIELCSRDEAITMEEAGILGQEVFVRVAEIREKEQRRKGELTVKGKAKQQPTQSGSMSPSTSNTTARPVAFGSSAGIFGTPPSGPGSGAAGRGNVSIFGRPPDPPTTSFFGSAKPNTSAFGAATTGRGTVNRPFFAPLETTAFREKEYMQCISAMSCYSNFSPEELRAQDYAELRPAPATPAIPDGSPTPDDSTVERQVRQMLDALGQSQGA